jgi:hypothetical protein
VDWSCGGEARGAKRNRRQIRAVGLRRMSVIF